MSDISRMSDDTQMAADLIGRAESILNLFTLSCLKHR